MYHNAIFMVAQAVQVGSASAASANAERPNYADLLEIQGRQNQAVLEVQRKTFEAAIAASTQTLQSIEMLVGITALFLTCFSLAFGWLFKRYSDRMQGMITKSEKTIDRQGEQIAQIGTGVNELGERMELFKDNFNELSHARARFDDLSRLVTSQEIQITELIAKTRLALLGLDLRSGNRDDRLRAAQAISEFVRAPGNDSPSAGVGLGMAIKLLLDCLRRSDGYSPVVEEALYGLQHCARMITEDEDAINLILKLSGADEMAVQIQSIETLSAISVDHPKIEARLRELLESDNDLEVRALARRLLREAGKIEGGQAG